MAHQFTNQVHFTKKRHNAPYPFISPTRPELSCAGRNVLVTGGGTGIGQAIAIAFAMAGAKSVTIIGRREDKLQEGVKAISAALNNEEATEVLYRVADITKSEQVTAAFQSVVEEVGKLDVLVSNACGPVLPGSIESLKAEDLMSMFDTNVLGALHVVHAFLPLGGPEPIILNTSSCVVHWASVPETGIYSITKVAALKLFDMLAAENPRIHIVNIQPGWVATAVNGYQEIAPDSADLPGHFYVWLASPEAKFLRGKFVWANWDAQELTERAEEIAGSRLLRSVLDGVPM